MAWFFRHDSCSKKLAELRDRIVTAETEQRALGLQLADLYDRFVQYEGRMKKRVSREDTGAPTNGAAASAQRLVDFRRGGIK